MKSFVELVDDARNKANYQTEFAASLTGRRELLTVLEELGELNNTLYDIYASEKLPYSGDTQCLPSELGGGLRNRKTVNELVQGMEVSGYTGYKHISKSPDRLTEEQIYAAEYYRLSVLEPLLERHDLSDEMLPEIDRLSDELSNAFQAALFGDREVSDNQVQTSVGRRSSFGRRNRTGE